MRRRDELAEIWNRHVLSWWGGQTGSISLESDRAQFQAPQSIYREPVSLNGEVYGSGRKYHDLAGSSYPSGIVPSGQPCGSEVDRNSLDGFADTEWRKTR